MRNEESLNAPLYIPYEAVLKFQVGMALLGYEQLRVLRDLELQIYGLGASSDTGFLVGFFFGVVSVVDSGVKIILGKASSISSL
jgi:hypothetical protein